MSLNCDHLTIDCCVLLIYTIIQCRPTFLCACFIAYNCVGFMCLKSLNFLLLIWVSCWIKLSSFCQALKQILSLVWAARSIVCLLIQAHTLMAQRPQKGWVHPLCGLWTIKVWAWISKLSVLRPTLASPGLISQSVSQSKNFRVVHVSLQEPMSVR